MKKFSFSEEQMNNEVENAYKEIMLSCKKLINETKCSKEQIVALLSVVASNYAPLQEE